jgi:hypothetical protein
MIWFACNKCGKRQARPDTSAGTFIFCTCGQGNAVPWESTVAAEEPPPLPTVALPVEPLDDAGAMPPLPRMNAVPVGEERVPPRPAAPVPFEDPKPLRRPELDRDRAPRRRPGLRRKDPRFCLNHEERPTEHPCADCGDGFCADCLVALDGKQVCGPCKNFRVRKVHGPQRLSLFAAFGAGVAALFGPLVGCLLPISEWSGNVLVGVVALLPQLVAVALGALALRETELDPRKSGRALAVTAVVISGFVIFLTLFLTLFGGR